MSQSSNKNLQEQQRNETAKTKRVHIFRSTTVRDTVHSLFSYALLLRLLHSLLFVPFITVLTFIVTLCIYIFIALNILFSSLAFFRYIYTFVLYLLFE